MILIVTCTIFDNKNRFVISSLPVGSTTASPNDLYLSIATLSLQTPQIIASFFDRSSAWHKRLKREKGIWKTTERKMNSSEHIYPLLKKCIKTNFHIRYLFLFTAAKTQPKLEAVRRFLRTADQRQLSFCPTVQLSKQQSEKKYKALLFKHKFWLTNIMTKTNCSALS